MKRVFEQVNMGQPGPAGRKTCKRVKDQRVFEQVNMGQPGPAGRKTCKQNITALKWCKTDTKSITVQTKDP